MRFWVGLFLLLFAVEAGAVSVTSKAQFLAELPLTPGKTITITDQTISGGGDWGVVTVSGNCTQSQPCVIEAQSTHGVIASGQGALNLNVFASWVTIDGIRWTGQTSFGGGDSNGASSGALIALDGAQNVTLDNIKIDNISGGGQPIPIMELNGGRETENITIQNMEVDGWTQNAGSAYFIYVYAKSSRGYPEHITIKDSTFTNRTVTISTSNCCYWFRAGNSQGSITPGQYDTGDSDILIDNITVSNDSVTGNGQDMLHFKASGVRIQDSTFTNTTRVTNRQGDNWVFQRNTIINPNDSKNVDFAVFYNSGHLIANNLFYTNNGAKRALKLGKGNSDGDPDYTALNNAIIIGNTFDGFTNESITAVSNSNGNNDGTTTVFPSSLVYHNNAIRQSTGIMFDGPGGCGMFTAISHNARSGSAAADCQSSGTNNVTAAPLWADPNAGDYSLQAASPLIGAGVSVAGTTVDDEDHDSNSRDDPPDIGAFEFGGSPNPPAGTCDQIFSGVTGYELCSESGTECEFNATLGGSDCDTLCASFGKDCTAAYDNSTPACTQDATDTCSTVRATEICVCTIADSDPEDPPTPTTDVRQHAYKLYGALAADGEQALAGENVGSNFYINSRFNLTIAVRGDPGIDSHSREFVLYYEHCSPSCAAYTAVTATCTGNPVCLLDNPNRESGEPISNDITLDGKTFLVPSQYIDGDIPNGGEVIEVTIAADEQIELSFGLKTGSTVSFGDTIQFRIYNVDSTPLETYDVTPAVEIGSGRFSRSGGRQ